MKYKVRIDAVQMFEVEAKDMQTAFDLAYFKMKQKFEPTDVTITGEDGSRFSKEF